VPLVNWALLVMVILLVLAFRTSSNLASAYGIAVTGTMFITACMLGVLTFAVWKWHPLAAGLLTGVFLMIDGAYFASNVTKIPDGGWFPLLVAAIAFTALTTWSTGRRILRERSPKMPCRSTCSSARSARRCAGSGARRCSSPRPPMAFRPPCSTTSSTTTSCTNAW
jgi:KUP system potassium uptake protein